MLDTLESRRKRLLYRSRHRGMHETDLLLGRFAAARLANLDDADLARFEALLDEADADLFDWITGKRPAPPDADVAMVAMIRDHALAARTEEARES